MCLEVFTQSVHSRLVHPACGLVGEASTSVEVVDDFPYLLASNWSKQGVLRHWNRCEKSDARFAI